MTLPRCLWQSFLVLGFVLASAVPTCSDMFIILLVALSKHELEKVVYEDAFPVSKKITFLWPSLFDVEPFWNTANILEHGIAPCKNWIDGMIFGKQMLQN